MTSRKAQVIIASLGLFIDFDLTRIDMIYYAIKGHRHQYRLKKAYKQSPEDQRHEMEAPEKLSWLSMPAPPSGLHIPGKSLPCTLGEGQLNFL